MARRTHLPSTWHLVAAAVAAVALAAPGDAPAATINVNTTTDEAIAGGTCSLREAIISANTNAGGSGCTAGDLSSLDTINVPASASHYTLTIAGSLEDNSASGDLDIKS